MPRISRQQITAPHTLYHIVCRGNNQKRIFRGGRDYKKLLEIIRETKKKYPFYFYSFNLLPNHFHFELETIELSVSRIMHQINNLYVKYFRRLHGGAGHLFQGRFYSSLIDKDAYFWEVGSYIDLNAVKAGLAKRPEDYQWGSYSVYCQKDYHDNLIDRERFLGYVGEDFEKARLMYVEFVRERLKSSKNQTTPSFSVNEKMI